MAGRDKNLPRARGREGNRVKPGVGGRQGQKSGQAKEEERELSLARARWQVGTKFWPGLGGRNGNRAWSGVGGGKGIESGQG